MLNEITQEMIDAVGRELIERGLIVEAGYAGFKLLQKPPTSVAEQRERKAFFAGAQHLFASIMNSGLDEGVEPTDADMRRMDNIAAELKRFEEQLRRESTN